MAEEFVEGWTERINYTIYADGTAVNLDTMSATLLLYDKRGNQVSYAGTSGIETAASGLLYFDPSANDLLYSKSPYKVRWKVTDNSGQIAYFPNSGAEVWRVRKP